MERKRRRWKYTTPGKYNTNYPKIVSPDPTLYLVQLLLPHHHRTKMAPSESASATETPKPLAPSFGMLLSSTNFAPFLRASPSSSSSKKPHFVLPDIQASIASAADKCSQLLHSLVTENPLLSKLISLRCEFQSICHQVYLFPSALFLSWLFSILMQLCNCKQCLHFLLWAFRFVNIVTL